MFVVRQFSARCRTSISCIATVRLFFATPLSISMCFSTNLEIHSYSPNKTQEIIFYPEHTLVITTNTKSKWRKKRNWKYRDKCHREKVGEKCHTGPLTPSPARVFVFKCSHLFFEEHRVKRICSRQKKPELCYWLNEATRLRKRPRELDMIMTSSVPYLLLLA